MTASVSEAAPDTYDRILTEYLQSHSEEALYRVSLLSQGFIESGLGPEDIIALHFETLDKVLDGYTLREQARANGEAQQFLLEVMIAYGVRFKEYLELKLQEGLRDAEAQAAQERERALDAERVGRQKGEILGVIAHELRTPITAARGNLDLAARSLTRGQIERLPRLLETAREAVDRLSRLSADLVEASRGDPPALRLAPHELGPILAQACAWAEATAEAGGVRLRFEEAPIAVRARCDPDAVLSVFGNLLSNAIRYTPEGGQVTVRYGTDGEWAYAEFRDTGLGMAPEVQARIFEKFYRAAEARNVEPKGLGLGLSLVQDLTVAHDGRVEVESVEGAGSTFRVFFPISTDAEVDADV